MKIDKTRFVVVAGLFAASLGVLIAGCGSKKETPSPATGDAAIPVEPPDEDPPADSAPPVVPVDSGTDSGKDGGDGGVCLDDSTPAVQPACPGAGECQVACDNFAADYKKGLSADVRKCLTVAICTAGNTTTCSSAALAKACADPTATTFCTPMVTGCKTANPTDTITQAACEAIAKGLTAAGRAVLKTCFETEAICGDCPAKLK